MAQKCIDCIEVNGKSLFKLSQDALFIYHYNCNFHMYFLFLQKATNMAGREVTASSANHKLDSSVAGTVMVNGQFHVLPFARTDFLH